MLLQTLKPVTRRLLAQNKALVTASARCWASEAQPFVGSESDDDMPPSKIADILKTKDDPTLWIGQESMVIDAVRKMSEKNAAALLVFDPEKVAEKDDFPHNVDACVGILTERDYLRKIVVAGRSSFNTPVKMIMTHRKQIHVLTPNDTVLYAMQLMVKHDIRNLPVIDDKAMVAVLSIKDVVKAVVNDQKAEISVLKEFIHGSTQNGLA